MPGSVLSRRLFISGLTVSGFALLAGIARAQQPGDVTGSLTSVAPRAAKQSRLATQTEILQSQEPAMVSQGSLSAQENAIQLYEEIQAGGGWPQLPKDKYDRTLKGPNVALLRQRLVAENYLSVEALSDPSQSYDSNVIEAVVAFQRSHGLLPNGKVDEKTRQALNVPVEVRLNTLRVNYPRLQEYTAGLQERNILVNIAATQLETVERDVVYSRHNIVVGKLDRPTPALKSKVDNIVFNPFWNAPASIVEKDLIPKYRKNPNVFNEMRIRVLDGVNGPEIDPATVDWSITPADRYVFRQDPGDENALATMKINFPNKYMVYMHDTPHRETFQKNDRYESSGCVRIDHVSKVVDWILAGQNGIDDAEIKIITASQQTYEVKVANPPQVRFMYLTGWATEDGVVHFRDDVYKLDQTGFILGQPAPVNRNL